MQRRWAHIVLVFYAGGNGRASVLEYFVVANVRLALGIKRIIAPASERHAISSGIHDDAKITCQEETLWRRHL